MSRNRSIPSIVFVLAFAVPFAPAALASTPSGSLPPDSKSPVGICADAPSTGATVTPRVESAVCPVCNGRSRTSASTGEGELVQCDECGGTGYRFGGNRCGFCNGSGFVPARGSSEGRTPACAICGGAGRVRTSRVKLAGLDFYGPYLGAGALRDDPGVVVFLRRPGSGAWSVFAAGSSGKRGVVSLLKESWWTRAVLKGAEGDSLGVAVRYEPSEAKREEAWPAVLRETGRWSGDVVARP